jgi:putative addiction module killer protein
MWYSCIVPQTIVYENAAGISPFAVWHDGLDPVTRARVSVAVFRLEAGNYSAAKSLGGGVYELRLDFGPGYRIYFGKRGKDWIILLGGGTKKRQ